MQHISAKYRGVKQNLSPDAVSAIKQNYSKVKVAVSLGGAIVGNDQTVYFNATSVDSTT